jgi:hypothetical protein
MAQLLASMNLCADHGLIVLASSREEPFGPVAHGSVVAHDRSAGCEHWIGLATAHRDRVALYRGAALGMALPHCGGLGYSALGKSSFRVRCPRCSATVRWIDDNSVELNVSGAAASEVELVTRHLPTELALSRGTVGGVTEVISEARERWSKSRKAWTFVIGLATIAGGVAAVLALVIH